MNRRQLVKKRATLSWAEAAALPLSSQVDDDDDDDDDNDDDDDDNDDDDDDDDDDGKTASVTFSLVTFRPVPAPSPAGLRGVQPAVEPPVQHYLGEERARRSLLGREPCQAARATQAISHSGTCQAQQGQDLQSASDAPSHIFLHTIRK